MSARSAETLELSLPSSNRVTVTVIVPTFNRFHRLQRAVASVLVQTRSAPLAGANAADTAAASDPVAAAAAAAAASLLELELEVIVVNDASTEEAYYTTRLPEGVCVVHLPRNSGRRPGLVRNAGMGLALALAAAPGAAVGVPRAGGGRAAAPADYIAFLDDDDVWHDADKLVKQITAMRRLGVHMSSTLALDDPVGGGGDHRGGGGGAAGENGGGSAGPQRRHRRFERADRRIKNSGQNGHQPAASRCDLHL